MYKWIHTRKVLEHNFNQRRVLLKCKSERILPIYLIKSKHNANFSHPKNISEYNQKFFQFKILNQKIKYVHNEINFINKKCNSLEMLIRNSVNVDTSFEMFIFHHEKLVKLGHF